MHIRKEFYRYVLPSMLAFALSGVYAIADGFFVGNALGDDAPGRRQPGLPPHRLPPGSGHRASAWAALWTMPIQRGHRRGRSPAATGFPGVSGLIALLGAAGAGRSPLAFWLLAPAGAVPLRRHGLAVPPAGR